MNVWLWIKKGLDEMIRGVVPMRPLTRIFAGSIPARQIFKNELI